MKTHRFMFAAAPTSNITQKYDVNWSRIIWLNHVNCPLEVRENKYGWC